MQKPLQEIKREIFEDEVNTVDRLLDAALKEFVEQYGASEEAGKYLCDLVENRLVERSDAFTRELFWRDGIEARIDERY